ncbi:MAG: CaiB/BaiF CoA-transferase family protein [Acidimicrobiia bacterium]
MSTADGVPVPRTPLDGVRVLDLSQVVAGPLCGRVLADMGADVVKVEFPNLDRTREVLPEVNGQSLYFTHLNGGKRAIGIDLGTDEGAALVGRLAERVDVLIENFRPGVLARRGLGADDLLARNPRLVYCSISGWGQAGPWADRQAYAPLVHAETGRIELAARLRDAPPQQEVHQHGDINTALVATSAILGALLQAARTGAGQHLDVALAEALLYTDEWSSTDLHGYGRERFFDTWTHPVLTLADGSAVALVGNPVRGFDTWLAVLGLPARPRPQDDADALTVIRAAVAAVADFPTLERMLEAYPMFVAPVRSVAELAETDWARERAVFREIEPGVRVVATPYRSRQADVGVRGPAPRPGEHTRAVLRAELGLDDDALDALFASGAVF